MACVTRTLNRLDQKDHKKDHDLDLYKEGTGSQPSAAKQAARLKTPVPTISPNNKKAVWTQEDVCGGARSDRSVASVLSLEPVGTSGMLADRHGDGLLISRCSTESGDVASAP